MKLTESLSHTALQYQRALCVKPSDWLQWVWTVCEAAIGFYYTSLLKANTHFNGMATFVWLWGKRNMHAANHMSHHKINILFKQWLYINSIRFEKNLLRCRWQVKPTETCWLNRSEHRATEAQTQPVCSTCWLSVALSASPCGSSLVKDSGPYNQPTLWLWQHVIKNWSHPLALHNTAVNCNSRLLWRCPEAERRKETRQVLPVVLSTHWHQKLAVTIREHYNMAHT